MKLRHLVLAASAAVLSLGLTAAPQIGAPAPDFTVVDSKGSSHSLRDFAGKTVVLEWTNHDCPFVKKHYQGNMQALQQEMTAQDVVWLSVISSAPGKQGHVSPSEADDLTASRNAAPTAVVFDESGVVGQAYAAKTTPHMYVIDKAGVLQYMGGIDSIPSTKVDDIAKATPLFANAAKAVLAGATPDPAISKPYGCSVKY
ncbi:MAG: thioredoxin family protein [Alteromonadaceae bacterium]|jgi:peroxiredoxin|uniref:redoxin domain-containing protein n=1 Tax=Rheinheimera TaxID=67575 RepID=UPI000C420A70|nr:MULTISPECIES: redoxin domain-containing protein [Rheinheimera]MBJ91867.1 thioredoxin family protein [Alteromonadaceae bacterium]HBN89445.1 thioredoxin family protein [Rheinheimera sp.]|tara:strand:+ start:184 stop:783 length:600 start_codon:yes stop_codon:yes gene_type:complete